MSAWSFAGVSRIEDLQTSRARIRVATSLFCWLREAFRVYFENLHQSRLVSNRQPPLPYVSIQLTVHKWPRISLNAQFNQRWYFDLQARNEFRLTHPPCSWLRTQEHDTPRLRQRSAAVAKDPEKRRFNPLEPLSTYIQNMISATMKRMSRRLLTTIMTCCNNDHRDDQQRHNMGKQKYFLHMISLHLLWPHLHCQE